MGIEPVQAVVQGEEPKDWEDPAVQVPIDHAGLVEGILPFLGMALFIVFTIVRSLP